MRHQLSILGLSLSVALAAASAVSAQDLPVLDNRPGGAIRPDEGMRRPGSAMPVRPGTLLPVIDVFDDQGKTISTASLRGNYNVLVFGCLT